MQKIKALTEAKNSLGNAIKGISMMLLDKSKKGELTRHANIEEIISIANYSVQKEYIESVLLDLNIIRNLIDVSDDNCHDEIKKIILDDFSELENIPEWLEVLLSIQSDLKNSMTDFLSKEFGIDSYKIVNDEPVLMNEGEAVEKTIDSYLNGLERSNNVIENWESDIETILYICNEKGDLKHIKKLL